jgi:hypothetical protein
MGKIYQPEFLIIPYEVYKNEHLRPSDAILYGLIRYFEKMELKKCIASNRIIKELMGFKSERTVQD